MHCMVSCIVVCDDGHVLEKHPLLPNSLATHPPFGSQTIHVHLMLRQDICLLDGGMNHNLSMHGTWLVQSDV